MTDTVVFVSDIICLCILGTVIAAVDISPDRLRILETIVGGLLVVLGASGRSTVSMIAKRILKRK